MLAERSGGTSGVLMEAGVLVDFDVCSCWWRCVLSEMNLQKLASFTSQISVGLWWIFFSWTL